MEVLKLFKSIAKPIIAKSWNKNPNYYKSLSMTKEDLEQEIFIHFHDTYNKWYKKVVSNELEDILAKTVINQLFKIRRDAVIPNSPSTEFEESTYDVFDLDGHFVENKISTKLIPQRNEIILQRLPQDSFELENFIAKNTEQPYTLNFDIRETEAFLTKNEFFIIVQHFCNFRPVYKIGKELGITQQRASQIYKKALQKIKRKLKKDLLF